MSGKEQAQAVLNTMPDTATLQDIAERMALLAGLEKARQSLRDGRSKPQEEVEKLLPERLER